MTTAITDWANDCKVTTTIHWHDLTDKPRHNQSCLVLDGKSRIHTATFIDWSAASFFRCDDGTPNSEINYWSEQA